MTIYTILLIVGVVLFIAIVLVSGRVSWRFYQSTDNTNRFLLRVFFGGISFLLILSVLAAAGMLSPNAPIFNALAGFAGLVACGALYILIAREIWSIINKIRMMNAFRTLEKPEEQ